MDKNSCYTQHLHKKLGVGPIEMTQHVKKRLAALSKDASSVLVSMLGIL